MGIVISIKQPPPIRPVYRPLVRLDNEAAAALSLDLSPLGCRFGESGYTANKVQTSSPTRTFAINCVSIPIRASLRFKKRLNFSRNPRKLSIFSLSFSNRSEALAEHI